MIVRNVFIVIIATLVSACSQGTEGLEPKPSPNELIERNTLIDIGQIRPEPGIGENSNTLGNESIALLFKYDGFGPAHAPSKDGHYTYEYGFNGSLKRKSHPVQGQETYKYNHHHKLSRVQTFLGDKLDYVYDASGNRVAKRLNDGEEIERYFAAGIEKRGNKTLKFFFAGSKRLAEKSDSDNLVFYHQDNLGSTSVVTNRFAQVVTKRTYYEFGAQKESFELHQVDHDYNDKRLEKQTKLLDYHARQYAPSFFQFIQPDTIIPHTNNPQSYNRFAYVRNNPLIFIDPTGHEEELANTLKITFPRAPHFYQGKEYTFGGTLVSHLDVRAYQRFLSEVQKYGIDPVWAAAETIIEFGGFRKYVRGYADRNSYGKDYGYLPMDMTITQDFKEPAYREMLERNLEKHYGWDIPREYVTFQFATNSDVGSIRNCVRVCGVEPKEAYINYSKETSLNGPSTIAALTLGQIVQKRVLYYYRQGLTRNLPQKEALEFGLQVYQGYGMLNGEDPQYPAIRASDFPMYGQDVFQFMRILGNNKDFMALMPQGASTPIWDLVQEAGGSE